MIYNKGLLLSNQVRYYVAERKLLMLEYCINLLSSTEMQKFIGLTNKSVNFKVNIHPAKDACLLTMTIPDKPNSSNQKYVTTKKGLKFLKKLEEKK